MGRVRGLRKRRKYDINVSAAASGSGSGSTEKEGSEDCGEKLTERMNGFSQCISKCLGNFEAVFTDTLSGETFEYICSLVKDDMMTKPPRFTFKTGEPMSLQEQVAVAMRRLGSGESLSSIGNSVELYHSTVSDVTWKFVESMEQCGLHHLKWPSTENEMNAIKSKFQKTYGLPNCCGVIDTTHITLCAPSSEPNSEVWLDHKKKHSMVMQAIVDPDMRFMDIVAGWPGSMKDWLIFNNSNFRKLCDKGERLNGKKINLSEGSEIREYIIGDSGYPLLPYLVVPYEGNELSEAEAKFNKLHYATRLVAHRALSRLKEKWRFIHGMMWRSNKHHLPSIILVCCILHNIIIDMQQEQVEDELTMFHDHDEGYDQLVCGAVGEKGVAQRKNLLLYSTKTGKLHA